MRYPSDLLRPRNASSGSLRCLRLLEIADCAFELVAATGIAEPDDMAVVLGERTGLHRLAGPGAGFVDAISNVESAHRAFLRFAAVEFKNPLAELDPVPVRE